MSERAEREQLSRHARLAGWSSVLVMAAWMLVPVFRDGATMADVWRFAFLVIWCSAAWWALERAKQAQRTAYLVILSSVMLAALLIVTPMMGAGSVMLGAVMWAGMTVLIAIWGVYYERSGR